MAAMNLLLGVLLLLILVIAVILPVCAENHVGTSSVGGKESQIETDEVPHIASAAFKAFVEESISTEGESDRNSLTDVEFFMPDASKEHSSRTIGECLKNSHGGSDGEHWVFCIEQERIRGVLSEPSYAGFEQASVRRKEDDQELIHIDLLSGEKTELQFSQKLGLATEATEAGGEDSSGFKGTAGAEAVDGTSTPLEAEEVEAESGGRPENLQSEAANILGPNNAEVQLLVQLKEEVACAAAEEKPQEAAPALTSVESQPLSFHGSTLGPSNEVWESGPGFWVAMAGLAAILLVFFSPGFRKGLAQEAGAPSVETPPPSSAEEASRGSGPAAGGPQDRTAREQLAGEGRTGAGRRSEELQQLRGGEATALAPPLGRALAVVLAKVVESQLLGAGEALPAEELTEMLRVACEEASLAVLGERGSRKFSGQLSRCFGEVYAIAARIRQVKARPMGSSLESLPGGMLSANGRSAQRGPLRTADRWHPAEDWHAEGMIVSGSDRREKTLQAPLGQRGETLDQGEVRGMEHRPWEGERPSSRFSAAPTEGPRVRVGPLALDAARGVPDGEEECSRGTRVLKSVVVGGERGPLLVSPTSPLDAEAALAGGEGSRGESSAVGLSNEGGAILKGAAEPSAHDSRCDLDWPRQEGEALGGGGSGGAQRVFLRAAPSSSSTDIPQTSVQDERPERRGSGAASEDPGRRGAVESSQRSGHGEERRDMSEESGRTGWRREEPGFWEAGAANPSEVHALRCGTATGGELEGGGHGEELGEGPRPRADPGVEEGGEGGWGGLRPVRSAHIGRSLGGTQNWDAEMSTSQSWAREGSGRIGQEERALGALIPLVGTLPLARALTSQSGGGPLGEDDPLVRLISACERKNSLSLVKLQLASQQLAIQVEQLGLSSESNSLMRSSVALGHQKRQQRAEEARERREAEALGRLSQTMADELVAGMCVMLGTLLYSGWQFGLGHLAETIQICQTAVKAPRNSFWFTFPWYTVMETSMGALRTLACQLAMTGQVLGGLIVVGFVTVIFLQRDAADYQKRPIFAMLVTLGGFCGYAGMKGVASAGGDGLRWLLCWEVLCGLHTLAAWYPSILFSLLYGHPAGEVAVHGHSHHHTVAKLRCLISRYLFHCTVAALLPLAAGCLPFVSHFDASWLSRWYIQRTFW